jgi:hypothetical protein
LDIIIETIEHVTIVVVVLMNIKEQICIASTNAQMAIFQTQIIAVYLVQVRYAIMDYFTQLLPK